MWIMWHWQLNRIHSVGISFYYYKLKTNKEKQTKTLIFPGFKIREIKHYLINFYDETEKNYEYPGWEINMSKKLSSWQKYV